MPISRQGDTDVHDDITACTDPWRRSETVLLHHGVGRNLHFWRAWVPGLARNQRVLRVDAPGCGGSSVPPPGAPYTRDRLVDDVLRLMDAHGIERVHWGAEASGGHVGLARALRAPERVETITLVDTHFRLQ